MAVSAGTYGACNDKTLIRFDDFIRELRENPLYTTNIEYKLKVNPTAIVLCLSCVHLFSFFKVDDLGTEETIKGVYVIVDGGYHKWRATISASRPVLVCLESCAWPTYLRPLVVRVIFCTADSPRVPNQRSRS